MKQIHTTKPPVFVIIGLIISSALCVKMYFWWRDSETWVAFVLVFFFFLIFMVFANPLITWRTITVEDKILTVFKRFYRPVKVYIPDSLFQINMQNNKVHSFSFRVDDQYFQIVPSHYTKCDELSDNIMTYVKKKNVSINDI